ncbi:MAG: hypothetical protein U5K37_01180 [Natrialbaceae archaeon]|nr:hypothetical protein [Natrialbaceae archaeon]
MTRTWHHEETLEAPLVPYIEQPGEERDVASLKREIDSLRTQLNRIEEEMQTTTETR